MHSLKAIHVFNYVLGNWNLPKIVASYIYDQMWPHYHINLLVKPLLFSNEFPLLNIFNCSLSSADCLFHSAVHETSWNQK